MTLGPTPALELRKYPRAQLRLPVRIRWQSVLGMRLETAQTIDVSRGGLLVRRTRPCTAPSRVWVAFPYHPSAGSSAQPETLARVVRVESESEGVYRAGLHLDLRARTSSPPHGSERRAHPRVSFALPIFVRPVSSAWPEESMTRDVSPAGASFETFHIYASGDAVFVKIPWGEWGKAGELHARVVRVEYLPDQLGYSQQADPDAGVSGMVTRVSVRWTKPANSIST
jgi:hypothetical protein